jgi:hypothetical protein
MIAVGMNTIPLHACHWIVMLWHFAPEKNQQSPCTIFMGQVVHKQNL